MTRAVVVLPRRQASAIPDRVNLRNFRSTALSCRWIETGNPAQPLACVWIDRDLLIAKDRFDSLTSTGSADPPLSWLPAHHRGMREAWTLPCSADARQLVSRCA
jgi:hypothetical protein